MLKCIRAAFNNLWYFKFNFLSNLSLAISLNNKAFGCYVSNISSVAVLDMEWSRFSHSGSSIFNLVDTSYLCICIGVSFPCSKKTHCISYADILVLCDCCWHFYYCTCISRNNYSSWFCWIIIRIWIKCLMFSLNFFSTASFLCFRFLFSEPLQYL